VQARERASARALQRRGWHGPLRWAVCQLLTAGLRVGDALVDRQIRRFRAAG